jgi:hypothetical protein
MSERIELTEESVGAFEKADADLEATLGWWWAILRRLEKQQAELHDEFRRTHRLTGSNLHSIADWRWKNNHP